MMFQTCMTFFSKRFLKNISIVFVHIMEVKKGPKKPNKHLIDIHCTDKLKTFFKISSTEVHRSYKFGTTWWWANHEFWIRIFFLKIRQDPNKHSWLHANITTAINETREGHCGVIGQIVQTHGPNCPNDPQFPPSILNKHLRDVRGKIIIYSTCVILSGLLKACVFSKIECRPQEGTVESCAAGL